MIILKVGLERKAIGEKREFSAEIYIDEAEENITQEYLQDLTFKIAKTLCEKGEILRGIKK